MSDLVGNPEDKFSVETGGYLSDTYCENVQIGDKFLVNNNMQKVMTQTV